MTKGRGPGRPRGVQQDPALRRAKLLTAAEDAIRDHGPGASMEQIAERAGVSKATLYDNFDGKTGLTMALIDRYGRRLIDAFTETLDRPLTAEQVVREGIAVFVALIDSDPEIYRFVVRNAEGDELVAEITMPIAALIVAVLGPEADRDGRAAALAHATLGAIITATEWWTRNYGPAR